MNELFADTSFFVSFLNAADEHHEVASRYMRTFDHRIVTSDLVLVELGNYLSRTSARRLFFPFVRDLRADKRFEIIACSTSLIDAGMLEYSRRQDKSWSLTDCVSFILQGYRICLRVFGNSSVAPFLPPC